MTKVTKVTKKKKVRKKKVQKKKKFKTLHRFDAVAAIDSLNMKYIFSPKFGNKTSKNLTYGQFVKKINDSLLYHLAITTQFMLQEFLKDKFEVAEQEFKILINKINQNQTGSLKVNLKRYNEWVNLKYLPLFDHIELFKILYVDHGGFPRLAFKNATPQLTLILNCFGKSKLKSELRKKLKKVMFANFKIINSYYKARFGIEFENKLIEFYQNLISENMEFAAIFLEIHSLRVGDKYTTANFDIELFVKKILRNK